MRPAALALLLVGAAIGVLFAVQPDRASADYNISGQWFLELNGGTLCKAIVTETYDNPPSYNLSMLVGCVSGPPFGKMTGSIDANTGSFSVSRTDSDPISGGSFSMKGTVSPDNHSMSGVWIAHSHVTPGLEGTFTGTGGNGDPKPPLVGGIVLDVAPDRAASDAPGSGGSTLDTWSPIAIASAAILMLAGVAVYAWKRVQCE